MSIDAESLRSFSDSISSINEFTINENVIKVFKDNCNKIISSCKKNFPEECGQICLLIKMLDAKIISAQQVFQITGRILIYMADEWDKRVKPKKIFISHSTDDREIIDKFVALLEKIGVQSGQLFCSSIQGYSIPQGSGDLYDFIRNEMSNDNLFAIMMLSQNYYNSPVCLNEMGAAWVKQSEYQSILLPNFNYPDIRGAINPRDISFQLNDELNRKAALNELKDRIIAHLGLNNINHNVWERIRDTFLREVDQIVITPNVVKKSMPVTMATSITDLTDNEKIILYYVHMNKVRTLKKSDVLMWVKTSELDNVNIESAFDLLSADGKNSFVDETLTLDIVFFRQVISDDVYIENQLKTAFESNQNLHDKKFMYLWNENKFDDSLKLFVSYIIDERVTCFGDRWQANNQIKHIEEWESKNNLYAHLSKNYTACLNFLIQNNFVYDSDWTSYGNPREYRLYPSVEKLLLSDEFQYNNELLKIKDIYKIEFPF